jgi:hypothetical protein
MPKEKKMFDKFILLVDCHLCVFFQERNKIFGKLKVEAF